MEEVASYDTTLLALLMVFAIHNTISPNDATTFSKTVGRLPDEFLAIIQPHHIARFVHLSLMPGDKRRDGADSRQLFFSDEARMPFLCACLYRSSLRASLFKWLECSLELHFVSTLHHIYVVLFAGNGTEAR